MREGSSDTDPEAERVQLDLFRRAGSARRLQLALSLSRTVMRLSRGGIARSLEGAAPEELGLRFVEIHYGAALAEALRAYLRSRRP